MYVGQSAQLNVAFDLAKKVVPRTHLEFLVNMPNMSFGRSICNEHLIGDLACAASLKKQSERFLLSRSKALGLGEFSKSFFL